MTRLLHHVRTNAIAYLALFVALGGTGYAVTNLPANSVGARQIRNHSITPIKFDRHAIAGSIRAYAVISASGKVVASRPKARVIGWSSTLASGIVSWGIAFPIACFPLGSAASGLVSVNALRALRHVGTGVQFEEQTASGASKAAKAQIAVVCPQP